MQVQTLGCALCRQNVQPESSKQIAANITESDCGDILLHINDLYPYVLLGKVNLVLRKFLNKQVLLDITHWTHSHAWPFLDNVQNQRNHISVADVSFWSNFHTGLVLPL